MSSEDKASSKHIKIIKIHIFATVMTFFIIQFII